MDYRLSIPLAMVALAAIGFARLVRIALRIGERSQFAVEFLEQFQKYAASRGQDTEAYGWLVHRSTKMQQHMGDSGIYAYYKPPFANYQVTNYAVVLNGIPELRQAYETGYVSDVGGQTAAALLEAIVRYMGQLDDLRESHLRDMKNPFVWLRDGVRLVIASPVYLLSWMGALGESTASAFIQSRLFKIVSGLVALVGLVAGVMTIVLGWDQFLKLIGR
jgi:hypothetical protein